ncbi:hypothetical protein MMC25_006501 [Agyrium rufum]|nr:hypothetical protein [Agyrium rufum]
MPPSQVDRKTNAHASLSEAEQEREKKKRAAKEVIDILEEISILLNVNLNRQQLSIAISLIENGINPHALAAVVKDLRGKSEEGREREGDRGR